jgi:hypothetical protein
VSLVNKCVIGDLLVTDFSKKTLKINVFCSACGTDKEEIARDSSALLNEYWIQLKMVLAEEEFVHLMPKWDDFVSMYGKVPTNQRTQISPSLNKVHALYAYRKCC